MPPRLAAALVATLLSTTSPFAQTASPPSLMPNAPDDAAPIAVTRVTLATGGLAEVEGRMTAPAAAMRLAIERPQVADVLRTLVVTGPSPVLSIDLAAAEPVGERSPAGKLLAGDLADPATVLQFLIGAEVVLRGGANQLQGQLLAFALVDVPQPVRGDVLTPARPGVRVAVATTDGRVTYATFETLDQLAIEGDAVAERMAGVVPALAETVDDARRELTVRLAAPAEAGFSFVVPTTVWRPSYRAVIGADGGAMLQGWGTLENTTGLDWRAIDLSLAVGTPVAYAQDVYSPLRTTRPDAPFEVGRTVETDVVAGAMFEALPAPAAASDGARFRLGLAQAPAAARSRARAAPAEVVTGAPAITGTAATVFNVAGKIDLAAGRTLTVPFLSGTETVNRITYLDVRAARQPMDALELTFDKDATVPGGLVAVYDTRGFVGDARFGGADGGETKILPFAVTADVNATVADDSRSTFASATLRSGSLAIVRSEVNRTAIRIEARRESTLVADVARASGDTVEASVNAGTARVVIVDTTTARVRATVPTGAHTLVVTTTRPVSESYSLSSIPSAIVEEVLSQGAGVDEATKRGLREVAEVTRRIAEIGARIATLDADVADLRAAVANDRDNLEAIDVRTEEGAGVRRRIIERTNEIDTALGELSRLRRERDAEGRKLPF